MHRIASVLVAAAGLLLAGAGQPQPNPPSATEVPATPPAPASQPVAKTTAKPPPPAPAARTEQVSPEGASGIIDTTVHDTDGADIGHIIDVLVDGNGKPKAAMIDFGGFLGVGSRKVAVAWTDLHFKPAAPQGMMVSLDLNADQIKTALLGKETKPPATVVVKKDPAAPAAQAKTGAQAPDKATGDKATSDTTTDKTGTDKAGTDKAGTDKAGADKKAPKDPAPQDKAPPNAPAPGAPPPSK